MRRILIAAAAVLACGAVQAQTRAPLPDNVKAMLGDWEFSNADRDKVCSVRFSAERAGAAYKLKFDDGCAALFPLVKQIAGWKYPKGDLLYLVDARGRALIEFSEAEAGSFEAPTPGLGVLFLRSAAAGGREPSQPREAAGAWTVVRGGGPPLCVLTLGQGGFSVTAQPGCDPELAKLDFTQWRLDGRELMLIPANGDPWRFEETDDGWRLMSGEGEPLMLVRQ